jgi:hypothetical protein
MKINKRGEGTSEMRILLRQPREKDEMGDVCVYHGKEYSRKYLRGVCEEVIEFYRKREEKMFSKDEKVYYARNEFDSRNLTQFERDSHYGLVVFETSLPQRESEMVVGAYQCIYDDNYYFYDSLFKRERIIKNSTVDWIADEEDEEPDGYLCAGMVVEVNKPNWINEKR